MRRFALVAFVALSAVSGVALAGCASSGGVAPGGPDTWAPTASTTPTASASAAPTSPGTDHEPTDPAMLGPGTRTVTGVVHQGAEPSCLILQSAYGPLELLDPKPVPHDGDRVRVTGHLVQAMSHCMQGRPFVVEQLTIG